LITFERVGAGCVVVVVVVVIVVVVGGAVGGTGCSCEGGVTIEGVFN
jgi:hypothetical protein